MRGVLPKAPDLAGDAGAFRDVFVNDRQTGETTMVSVSSAGVQANGPSGADCCSLLFPSISHDGRYVGFHSAATNLVPVDTNAAEDAFVRDRVLETTSACVETRPVRGSALRGATTRGH
jgi:hypothetical protein